MTRPRLISGMHSRSKVMLGSRPARSFRPVAAGHPCGLSDIGEASGGSDPVPVSGTDRPGVTAMPRAPFGYRLPRDRLGESRLRPE